MNIQIMHLPIPPPGGGKRHKGRFIALFSLLAVAVVLLFAGSGQRRGRYDPSAGVKPEKDGAMAVSREKLQQMAEDSRFGFQINTQPEFENGESPGTLFLENSVENSQDMRIILELKEDGRTVYESPVLHPGEQVLKDHLAEALAGGAYPALTRILIVDPETGEQLGENTVAVTLMIKGDSPG